MADGVVGDTLDVAQTHREQRLGWLPDTSQVRDSRDSQLRSVTVG
jgi:hypothetical protein